jgi:hypothetical protein
VERPPIITFRDKDLLAVTRKAKLQALFEIANTLRTEFSSVYTMSETDNNKYRQKNLSSTYLM